MNYIMAFLFSGLVCFLAQMIYDNSKLTPGHITSLFVVIGSFLDLFHIYDKLIEIFHAGALIPITSFGHSLMHGAMAATKQYGIFGIAMGMFDLTAAGITAAILFGFLVAIIFKPKS
ncbi:stage V sporulation protein AE [Candidatus Stoquefichus sp. SB1]|jgi:stage V sporulation protein AE|uniref:stage V sporulation protein AE n=1 Tax=Candidatus Stoquefichus sp. SB1 TaxID=1658109 RepID=UPI00067F5315|nr:stage V sporulation protein AE [Candidatus Stoquefichus sp. SB1]